MLKQELPASLTVDAEEIFTLSVIVHAQPEAHFRWLPTPSHPPWPPKNPDPILRYINNFELSEGPRVRLDTSVPNRVTAAFHPPHRPGQLKVVAANAFGQTTSTTTLTIRGPPRPAPPTWTRMLCDATAAVGETATLSVAATGIQAQVHLVCEELECQLAGMCGPFVAPNLSSVYLSRQARQKERGSERLGITSPFTWGTL